MTSRLDALLVYTHPRAVAIFFLGIASGLPLAMVLGTLSVWLSEAGVTRTAIGLFAAVTTPYSIKFLWSPLVDQLRLPLLTRLLGRRRAWMILSQCALAVSLIGLGLSNPTENAWMTALFALLVAISSATQDIVIDAYRVEILEEDMQGVGAAMIVFGYRVGMLISGAGALFIAANAGWFVAYVCMAVLVGVGALTVMITGEPVSAEAPKEEKESVGQWLNRAVVQPFADFMKRPEWLVILAFIVLYKFGDAFAGVMTNPFLIEIGFSKEEIAIIVKTYGFAAAMLGSFIGGLMVSRLHVMHSLWICGILQMVSNLMFLLQVHAGHNPEVLALVIAVENISGSMGTTAFVAYISGLCHVRYTATQYALFSSLASVGRTWLSASSGWFVDQLGWSSFFILSTAIALPGLLILLVLRRMEKKNLS